MLPLFGLKNWWGKLQDRAFRPVDIASLVFFRVVFGLLMCYQSSWYLSNRRIERYWLEPRMLFKYYGFEWVQPLPGHGLHILFVVLCLAAFCFAIGFCYRAAVLIFCVGYTYTF